MATQRQRKRYFVDPIVQKALLIRCGLHWGLCAITAALLLLSWHVVTHPGQPTHTYFVEIWNAYWRAFLISVVLLAIVMRDVVQVSNRFCGPLLRMRQALQKFSAGERVETIRIRENDFWHEFAGELNAALAKAQSERDERSGTVTRSAGDESQQISENSQDCSA